ncbi:MAG: Histidine-tRNA ligase [Candidatus Magasanikbacteria bacterium GW2011_GWC2_40_17]|uniref:Histidine--tRNA ligase n=1 Tax=Candidatus Magasanikbacteria bacterium GW2011_GWA2_42_32 TaxID=1619039 RepID=A0A0G1CDV4_9BACT|nr:MAG: Histidine-tRNA ligase [Candidatus Magasanikbacteria bacterium GW2011_GWC2_40_17]KKS56881.1 MAG: Histidine-tRNA ligase [Candidatus Magasanikbacteria bacterium GW2011_GWA2_42_32]
MKEKKVEKNNKEATAEPIKKTIQTPQPLRGMKDILPSDQGYWWLVFDKVRALAKTYGFEKIDTPLLEEATLFSRSIGKETDIVEKEMYIFEDLDGQKLALRPEATASIMRAFLNHGMWNLPQPIKAWYWGPMFRHERPQSGRYRQFHQFGFEILGEDGPVADAMIIMIAYNFYAEMGVNASIQINSLGCQVCRENYKNELVQYYKTHRSKICETCKKRMQKNPLRLLDCKEPGCISIKEGAPQMIDFLCDDCRNHFMSVLEYLDELGLPYFLNHNLVRGLDYYTRTVFEIYSTGEDEGSQSALGGGGRYDLLSEALGGKPVPACGFAHGVERAVNKIKEAGRIVPETFKAEIFIAQLGEQARRKAFTLFEKFKHSGIKVAEAFCRNSLRAQLEQADKLGARYALIVGQKEVQDGSVIIRDMESGVQETIDVNKAVAEIQKKMLLV